MCHHINGNCLYINWLRPHCRITTRLPCCALTFRSFKTDTAFCFHFSFFSFCLADIKECSVCSNGKVVMLTSVMQQHSKIRQLLEDRHLCGDARVFQLKWHWEGSLHWTHLIYTIRWCFWQLLSVIIHACSAGLDKWDTWQSQPRSVWGCSFSTKDSRDHTK